MQATARVLLKRAAVGSRRSFHSTRPAYIKVGDKLPPAVALVEKSPGNKVDLSEEAKGLRNMLVIGVRPSVLASLPVGHDREICSRWTHSSLL